MFDTDEQNTSNKIRLKNEEKNFCDELKGRTRFFKRKIEVKILKQIFSRANS